MLVLCDLKHTESASEYERKSVLLAYVLLLLNIFTNQNRKTVNNTYEWQPDGVHKLTESQDTVDSKSITYTEQYAKFWLLLCDRNVFSGQTWSQK